jgi:hypothetical protein
VTEWDGLGGTVFATAHASGCLCLSCACGIVLVHCSLWGWGTGGYCVGCVGDCGVTSTQAVSQDGQ